MARLVKRPPAVVVTSSSSSVSTERARSGLAWARCVRVTAVARGGTGVAGGYGGTSTTAGTDEIAAAQR
jgi:hypothetical protein